jgi:hypothetical protein
VNDNRKKKGKPYFLFEDGVSHEKIQGRVSRIHKTVTTHYKYRRIHTLYSRPSTNPLALTMYNKISNFMFGDTSAPLSDGLQDLLSREGMEQFGLQQGNTHYLKKEMECAKVVKELEI